MIVNGYAYPTIRESTLLRWVPFLNYISCFSYGISREGNLIGLDDERLRSRGVPALIVLTPMDENGVFSNNLANAVLSDETKRTRLMDDLERTVAEKNMAGVDFDFEYIYKEDKENYAKLIGDMRERLKDTGGIVTAALAPKTSADQQGLLYEGHDYRLIGEAADYCLLMTYEWGYTYGPPMAVAPVNNVRRVIEYGISEIPADKILMGIANYGYDWKLPYIKGETKAEKLSREEAEARAGRYGAEIIFDEATQSPTYKYVDETGAEHEVWFENRTSFEKKLELVAEYSLAGISVWNIMEPPLMFE